VPTEDDYEKEMRRINRTYLLLVLLLRLGSELSLIVL